MAARLRTTIVRTTEEFAALREPWNRLCEEVEGATVFQSHAFLAHWWDQCRGDKEFRIVCAYDGDDLCGVLPLQAAQRKLAGFTRTVIEFVGMPNELLRPTFIVRTGDTESLYALLDALVAGDTNWRLLQLDEMAIGSWFHDAIRDWSEHVGLIYSRRPFHACPYLIKSSGWDEFVKSKSRRFAKRLRQARAKFSRHGEVAYLHAGSRHDIGDLVTQFFAVEDNSWKASAGLACGEDADYRAFCGSLLTDPGAGIQGHAIVQTVNGQPSAATIGFSSAGVYYALQIAHDSKFDSFSPGTLLEAYELEWFFNEETLNRYEFLGGEVFNKRRWTDTAVATEQVCIRKRGLHMALRDLAKHRVMPLVRASWATVRRRKTASCQAFRCDPPRRTSGANNAAE